MITADSTAPAKHRWRFPLATTTQEPTIYRRTVRGLWEWQQATDGTLMDLPAQLGAQEQPGRHEECESCDTVPAHPATVRIYGRPGPEFDRPDEFWVCCACCAPGLIRRAEAALAEGDTDPIDVEFLRDGRWVQ